VPSDYSFIQDGIDAASENDSILVAPGVYRGPGNKNLTLGSKNLVIHSENGATATLIDCEGKGRGFFLSGVLTPATVINGFTFINGHSGDQPLGGGGMFIAGGSPTIMNCHFERNVAAGALQIGGGGGLCIYNSASLIDNCEFVDNEAIGSKTLGGGIAIHSSHVRILNCRFEGNGVSDQGGGGGIGVGAIVADTTRAAVIENCEFDANRAWLGGGAFLLRSQLLSCAFTNNEAFSSGGLSGISVTLDDCAFIGNIASEAAGGATLTGQTAVSRSLFAENSAPTGGGIICSGLRVTLSDCIISGNNASFGGGVYGVTQGSMLVRCTIVGNQAQIGGGLLFSAGEQATWRLENCIIAANGPGAAVVCEGGANAALSCCDVHGNMGGDWVGCIMDQDGTNGNFSADPLFCQGGNDWHLCSDSPCAPNYSGACGLIGALPVGCSNCGAALAPSTWGQIKYQARRPAPAPIAGK
jgi:hypothetical protein